MNTVLDEVLRGFTSVEWSSCPDELPKQPGRYVYVFVVETGNLFFPLYAGQTSRLFGRFGDYQYASFQAPTDFRVGGACKFLRSQGATIRLFFRDSTFPLREGRLLQRELVLAGFPLLNSLRAFDRRVANTADELQVLRRFCEMAVCQARLVAANGGS
jgi:hypothetical protein